MAPLSSQEMLALGVGDSDGGSFRGKSDEGDAGGGDEDELY